MNMKLRWTAFGILVAGSLAYALWPAGGNPVGAPLSAITAPERATAPPKSLVIHPAAVEFGPVPVGDTKTREVTVENKGLAPVTIYRVSGSCECISGKMAESMLPPGGKSTATLRFTGIAGRGSYAGSATIITDEAGPSHYEIGVHGLVEEDLMLEPSAINFGTLSRNATTFQEVRVRQREGQPFLIRGLADGEGFEAKWVPVDASAGGGYKMTIRILPGKPGLIARKLRILTDRTAMPELQLAVSGEVESDLRMTPSVLELKPAPEGRGITGEVLLENGKGEAFRIRSVRDAQSQPIQFSVTETGPSSRTLRIDLTETATDAPPIGEFLIQVDIQEAPLRLPYRRDPSGRKAQ